MVKGIYKITNDRTGEIYVGQSVNIDSRKNKHLRELAKGTHHNKGLQKDHNLGDTFTFEILEELSDATMADLKNKESHYVTKFNSFREGYNLTPGGAMDQFKGKYKYGGGRLPSEKYKPTRKYLSKALANCPVCNGHLIKKKGEYGDYAGCDNFPKCGFTCSLDDAKYYNSIQNYNKNFIDTEFQSFCKKKNNYLTRSDCDYLAKKYDMDISKANTVKKANSIIKNYLNESQLWETAMKDLYNYNNSSETFEPNKESVGEQFPNWCCPKCGSRLKRASEFFIQCEEYPDCSFYCSESFYVRYHLKETDIATESHTGSDPTANKNINYCSGCGYEIDLEDLYCCNCGKEIDEIFIGLKDIDVEKTNKITVNNDSSSKRDTFLVAFIVCVVLIFFILSAISNFDATLFLIDIIGQTIAIFLFFGIMVYLCTKLMGLN